MLWRVLLVYGFDQHVVKSHSVPIQPKGTLGLHCQQARLLPNSLPVGVGLHQSCPFSLILFTIFIHRISRHRQVAEGIVFVAKESHLYFFLMICSSWLQQVVASSSQWSGLRLSVKQSVWELGPKNLRLWSSDGKGWSAHFGWGKSCCPKLRTLSILGIHFFTSEGRGEWEDPDMLEKLYLLACLRTPLSSPR